MGNENMPLWPGKLYIEGPETGRRRELTEGIIEGLHSISDEEQMPKYVSRVKPGVLMIECYLSPLYRKLSRKRFVKLLMAWGSDRNTAHETAEFWRRFVYSYSDYTFWFIARKK